MHRLQFRTGEWLLILFNLAYIGAFGAYYLWQQNSEFLWYIAVLLFFFLLIGITLRRSGFSYPLLWGLSLWGLLHMAGGGIPIGDNVLYAVRLIPVVEQGDLIVLKYDQVVHFFGFAIATFVVYHLLSPYLRERTRKSVLFLTLAAAGMGLGTLNEIVEFAAVLSFPETGVGGYYNTSLDLVFNALGASSAAVWIVAKRRQQPAAEMEDRI
jgi:putative membrane protein